MGCQVFFKLKQLNRFIMQRFSVSRGGPGALGCEKKVHILMNLMFIS